MKVIVSTRDAKVWVEALQRGFWINELLLRVYAIVIVIPRALRMESWAAWVGIDTDSDEFRLIWNLDKAIELVHLSFAKHGLPSSSAEIRGVDDATMTRWVATFHSHIANVSHAVPMHNLFFLDLDNRLAASTLAEDMRVFLNQESDVTGSFQTIGLDRRNRNGWKLDELFRSWAVVWRLLLPNFMALFAAGRWLNHLARGLPAAAVA
eukprot:NODE_21683_length_741_cov_3.890879.p1 GENE.NODE_21683_length_741_cov_3.890879~~NODE_21683_length_741_cov_3.890879.p1  ORF type:complete len:226 (-),score=29.85 NODE_21683_length_741_cov_3.890879:64-687(-)